MTLYQLAEALKVTPRTMRRYLKEIEREYDLEPTTTRGGGPLLWKIRAGEIPRKIEVRRTQAYALLAARRIFEPMRGSALFDEIDIIINKLLSFAQRPGRGPNAGLADVRLEDRFLYLPFAPKNYARRTEELDDLFQSVSDLRPLSMRYKSASRGVEERITVHPYAMVLHRDSIYCVGYHTGRGEVRTFVLDRMRDTQSARTERFALPADVRIDDYFQGEFGIWKADKKHKVVIEFDARAADYVRMRRMHPSQKLSATASGGLRLSMTVGNLTQLTSWVLEWGERARVISPPELLERVQGELAAALALYQDKKPTKATGTTPKSQPVSTKTTKTTKKASKSRKTS